MEKRRPTYDIEAIKRAIGRSATLSIKVSAFLDATALGYDRHDVAEVIRSVTRTMFYKSMTTFGDNRLWQDVYHVPSRGLVIYLKFQADTVAEFTVMSFKEK